MPESADAAEIIAAWKKYVQGMDGNSVELVLDITIYTSQRVMGMDIKK